MLDVTFLAGRLGFFLGSGRCQKALASCVRDLPLDLSHWPSGQNKIVENLWRDLFRDPSQWWDHRVEKGNARYPDFKHKKTQKALWLNGKETPPWVEKELAALPPGTIPCNVFSWNTILSRCVKTGQYKKTLDTFRQMQKEGIKPDRFTFVPLLNSCANLGALEEGRWIHAQIIQTGFEFNVYVGSSLVEWDCKTKA